MREWCGCGAAIYSPSYKRVLDWRTSHRHPDSGPSGAESDTERSDQDDDMVVKIGFRPNA